MGGLTIGGGVIDGAASALGGLFGGGGAKNDRAEKAAAEQSKQTDIQQAQTIYAQIAADAQKQRMERWKLEQDVQTKIFEIIQDVAVNKCKTADKCCNAFDGYIRA